MTHRLPLLANQNGSSLIIGMMFLTLISTVGMTFLTRVMAEDDNIGQDQNGLKAQYSADAGCMEALTRLADPASSSYIGLAKKDWIAKPGWGLYLRSGTGVDSDPSLTDPEFGLIAQDKYDNDNDKKTDEVGESYPVQFLTTTTDNTNKVRFLWTKAKLKVNSAGKIVLFGDDDGVLTTPPRENLTDGEPVLLVTAMGKVGDSTTRVELECVRTSATGRYLVWLKRAL